MLNIYPSDNYNEYFYLDEEPGIIPDNLSYDEIKKFILEYNINHAQQIHIHESQSNEKKDKFRFIYRIYQDCWLFTPRYYALISKETHDEMLKDCIIDEEGKADV